MISYGSIVPLIGGESLGIQESLGGTTPEWVLSYKDFEANDAHYVNYLRKKGWEGDYVFLDENKKYKAKKVDVVNTVCPCAGLSTLSAGSSGSNPVNNWMYETAEYVLGTLKPKVFWGENAPRLAQKTGIPVVKKLREIGKENGYSLSIYKTKSLVQGFSQIRDRTFYFFWKGDKVPLFNYIGRPNQKIEDLITSVPRNPKDPMNVLLNKDKPSDFPLYKYILEVIHDGISHKEFIEQLDKSINAFEYIEKHDSFDNLLPWLKEREHTRCYGMIDRMNTKLKAGLNVMRRTTTFPKDYIGAFVGHLPKLLTHPVEDRYLTVREAMEIMYLPRDMDLLNVSQYNHICQNVPLKSAKDMMDQVKKYFDNQLDLIDTPYLLQDNKRRVYEYEKNCLQLDEFMV
tara:strand:- start:3704 stop:4903 length:1200 start_codon:yes stop_codon:yes gene_type:complete